MCKILLSINPVHVENILNGKKQYELRKIECKEKVDKIIIYSTSPIMKVVAEADVAQIIVNKPDIVWRETSSEAGISKKFFDEYFKGKEKAVAYKLINVIKYEKPKKLSHFGIDNAPQSFVYI